MRYQPRVWFLQVRIGCVVPSFLFSAVGAYASLVCLSARRHRRWNAFA
jgi:hypothetical protein